MSNLRLAFVIEAIDRATRPVRAVTRAVDRLAEPARRVQESYAAVKGVALGAVAAVAGVGFAAGAAYYSLTRVFDAVDRISDTAAELGITTQEFQRIGFAAKQSGSDAQEMAQAMLFLNRNMIEARSGNKETATWFGRVGITLRDLQNPAFTAINAIDRIADVFQQVGNTGREAGAKIAVSTALLGRAGFRTIQMLNGGSRGIKEFKDRADTLGVVIEDDTVKAITQFNDSLDELKDSAFGALVQSLKPAMPILQELVERVLNWTQANRELIAGKLAEWLGRVSRSLPAFLDGVESITDGVSRFVRGADEVAGVLGGWPNLFALLTGLMGVRLVAAVLSLASALGVLSVAAWANPLTWVLAAVTALVAAVPLLILHFDKVVAKLRQLRDAMPSWLIDALEGSSTGQLIRQLSASSPPEYPDGRLDRHGAAIVPTRTQQEAQEQALRDAGFGGSSRSTVGGAIGIRVDVDGRLKQVRSDIKAPFDFDVYAGLNMAGG